MNDRWRWPTFRGRAGERRSLGGFRSRREHNSPRVHQPGVTEATTDTRPDLGMSGRFLVGLAGGLADEVMSDSATGRCHGGGPVRAPRRRRSIAPRPLQPSRTTFCKGAEGNANPDIPKRGDGAPVDSAHGRNGPGWLGARRPPAKRNVFCQYPLAQRERVPGATGELDPHRLGP